MNEQQIAERTAQFKFFAGLIENVNGTIVECGIGAGNTLRLICQLFSTRKIFAIDSFKGFPEGQSIDGRGRSKHPPGKIPSSYYTETDVTKLFNINNIDGVIIPGFFSDTLPTQYPGNPIALLHLDCDLYKSYISALSLYQYVTNGGIVAFDEYLDKKYIGATKAIKQFLKRERKKIQCFELETFKKFYIIK